MFELDPSSSLLRSLSFLASGMDGKQSRTTNKSIVSDPQTPFWDNVVDASRLSGITVPDDSASLHRALRDSVIEDVKNATVDLKLIISIDAKQCEMLLRRVLDEFVEFHPLREHSMQRFIR